MGGGATSFRKFFRKLQKTSERAERRKNVKDRAGSAIDVSMSVNNKPGASSLHTRASLLGRLKNLDDGASWKEFDGLYRRLIIGVARRSGLSPEEADDAAQDTLAAVSRHIGEFSYDPHRCSFKTWLLQITRQRIIWQVRRRSNPAAVAGAPFDADLSIQSDGTAGRTDLIARLPDPSGTPDSHLDEVWDREWRQSMLAAALDRVKALVSERQFQIFELVTLQEWPVADVVRTLEINRLQVYLAKHRVGIALKRVVKSLERVQAAYFAAARTSK